MVIVLVLAMAALALVVAVATLRPSDTAGAPSPSAAATPSPSATPNLTSTPSPTATAASPSPAATATTVASTPSASGSITGEIAYPSNFIPPLTVYAISTTDQRVFFSVETPRYPLPTGATPAKPTYTISGVAPGTYYVLAYRNDDVPNKERPGVYSRYVVCGGTAACTDHSLVPMTVRAGETVREIDVTDWYYPQEQTYPPRPR